MLKGKTVVLAVSGSIAAYKMANVARMLLKQHCDVEVLMTQNATQFINPITFESLTGQKCLVDTFDRNFQYSVEPVALAKRADVVPVQTAADMYDAILSRAQDYDVIIKAAAVADYTPAATADNKIKKKDGDISIPLVCTKDILKALGENKRPGQILCGFFMETENVLENSRKKLESKHCDMICANSLKSAGAGFGTDTNIVTLITKDSEKSLELMSKEQVAHKILDKLLTIG